MKSRNDRIPDSSSPVPPGYAPPNLNSYPSGDMAQQADAVTSAPPLKARPRPRTSHQLRIERHRQETVYHELDLRLQSEHTEFQRHRESEPTVARAWRRIAQLPPMYDSDDEDGSWGPGGLVPNPGYGEEDDHGEEAAHWAKVMNKSSKRVTKWMLGDSSYAMMPQQPSALDTLASVADSIDTARQRAATATAYPAPKEEKKKRKYKPRARTTRPAPAPRRIQPQAEPPEDTESEQEPEPEPEAEPEPEVPQISQWEKSALTPVPDDTEEDNPSDASPSRSPSSSGGGGGLTSEMDEMENQELEAYGGI